jgi:hypothetical protein
VGRWTEGTHSKAGNAPPALMPVVSTAGFSHKSLNFAVSLGLSEIAHAAEREGDQPRNQSYRRLCLILVRSYVAAPSLSAETKTNLR